MLYLFFNGKKNTKPNQNKSYVQVTGYKNGTFPETFPRTSVKCCRSRELHGARGADTAQVFATLG